jgi:hypothetical protein
MPVERGQSAAAQLSERQPPPGSTLGFALKDAGATNTAPAR